jgi:hypothetical protein
MPTIVFSFKPPLADGTLLVHLAISPSKSRADAALQGHADVCPQYGPLFNADKTIEFEREVDEIPTFDGDSLEEWIAELLGENEDEDDDVIDAVPE